MNPVERFSDRVEDYIRYRPGYPPEVLDVLRRDCGLTPDCVIADVGCGPGNLALLFLENGNTVYGVEPNGPMRAAGEELLRRFERFHAVDARAESTALPTDSVDFVTAGQAFHWFQPTGAATEFRRILKPAGWVALIWNERGTGGSPFSHAYERILERYATDYRLVRQSRGNEQAVEAFFAGGSLRRAAFNHAQWFDFDGLKGRLLSSSYAPLNGQPGHAEMLSELRSVFEEHQEAGRVRFDYETTMWYGQLGPESRESRSLPW